MVITMKSLDRHYIELQFQNKIYSENGTKFQGFFENIMKKAFPDFKKVPSGGGDGGNDGWIKELGRYYQVYAPNTPASKDSEAADKLKKDFKKLKNEWNDISEIKEYYFVFNDKYSGSKKTEIAISELAKEHPNIQFYTFLAKDLERVFFNLAESDILSLGFNIDKRQTVKDGYKYLENIEIELDRENANFALKILKKSENIFFGLNDDNLSLKYEIIECRCLQKLEQVEDAEKKYDNISKRFPKDPRALLYLANIHLNNKDFNKNKELLKKAEEIDNNHWLLKLEVLVRKYYLGEKIDTTNINEKIFPDNLKVKANFYRLYAQFFEDSGDKTNADSFIEKAIHLNPERFSNYIVKLSMIVNRIFANQDALERLQKYQDLLKEIENVENKFSEYGDIGARNKASLNMIKLNVLRVQENYPEFGRISQETFKLSITCSFDKQIDQILAGLLMFVSLPDNYLNRLLEYLKNSKKEISEDLLKVLIFQFNIRDGLFNKGKRFFKEIDNKKYLDFINDLESENYKKVLETLENDTPFALTIVSTLKNFPVLRREIIENLPDDKDIKKEKLLLLLNFDEKKFDEAFKILKEMDLTNLDYSECKPILKIIQENKAWDFEIIILKKLLEKERDDKKKFNLKLQLFNAYFNLKKYSEVIDIGEQLLKQDSVENILDSRNKEALLSDTIIACFERGKFDKKDLKKSKKIREEYQ